MDFKGSITRVFYNPLFRYPMSIMSVGAFFKTTFKRITMILGLKKIKEILSKSKGSALHHEKQR